MNLRGAIGDRESEAATGGAVGRVRYWPAMDGMRAVAILAVLLCHAGLLPGGVFGVDVFFVLSGFLITAILLDESSRPAGIRLRRFYGRRALRLLPAVVVSVAAAVVVGQFVLTAAQRGLLGPDVLWIGAYVQNFHETLGSASPMLDQYWSLSMEEQFYILWSVILLGLITLRLGRRRIAVVLFGLAFVSSAWGTLLGHWGASPSRLATMLDTRGEGLLVGCGMALLFVGRPLAESRMKLLTQGRIPLGCVLVLLALFRLAPRNLEQLTAFSVHGGFLIVAAVTGVVVWHVVTGDGRSLVARLLSNRVMVWIGKLSYSLYLVHKIFYTALSGAGLPKTEWIVLSIAASFVAASLLHYGVELPFLQLKKRLSPSVAAGPGLSTRGRSPTAAARVPD